MPYLFGKWMISLFSKGEKKVRFYSPRIETELWWPAPLRELKPVDSKLKGDIKACSILWRGIAPQLSILADGRSWKQRNSSSTCLDEHHPAMTVLYVKPTKTNQWQTRIRTYLFCLPGQAKFCFSRLNFHFLLIKVQLLAPVPSPGPHSESWLSSRLPHHPEEFPYSRPLAI